FLKFAHEAGALTEEEKDDLLEQINHTMNCVGAAQKIFQADSEPVGQFLRLFQSCISSGRAHLAAEDGRAPAESPQSWGWTSQATASGTEWKPSGKRIGWTDGKRIFLDPDSAHAEVQRLASEKNDPLALSTSTLGKRLKERGLLIETEPERTTARRVIQGKRQHVWVLLAEKVSPQPETEPTVP